MAADAAEAAEEAMAAKVAEKEMTAKAAKEDTYGSRCSRGNRMMQQRQ